ncbi:MFS transporter [Pseudobacter ginsenosidimutans]|uniref:FSR family fosmidomycin resistance protein-like MFS transporter n=1 Tax=Pseudobacter ginsenosidimutans TaxID=661488 RepID=A0A4Q7MRR7_9BACT|nr:MFS transporter [Pseudobacter ginsenosidimutans]QEC41733.1 MFS transporter [Pseudobacter ginsenosidimutans]RZS71462.1 FSR family fosmidomycin resistance protein-like MFS transporter [Pseudobacter ginsenosidimutans]
MQTTTLTQEEKQTAQKLAEGTVFSVLIALSITHLLNDTLQSLIPAMYPLLRDSLHLDFSQIGLITLTFQMSASLLQPVVGFVTDKKPQPFSLAIGMSFTLLGLISLSMAHTFGMVLVSVALVGIGSAIFHPEASRLAYMAAGGRHGMAQSLFQVGGNAGSSLGPLLAAAIIVPLGQFHVIWFSLAALLAIFIMLRISTWYKQNTHRIKPKKSRANGMPHVQLSQGKVIFSVVILLVLIFSKYFYMTSLTSYYTFYLIDKFHISVQSAQIHLFIFLFSIAAGTFIGGPLGDRIGRKYVIWISILGCAPFTLLMPHANLFWTSILSVFIGVILSSAFSAILVYAQELMPGKVGMIAGLFFGFAFGMAGVGSALLGKLADATSISYVYDVCAWLPLIGILTAFLPNIEGTRKRTKA